MLTGFIWLRITFFGRPSEHVNELQIYLHEGLRLPSPAERPFGSEGELFHALC
jgi:hypothetical protein